MTEPSHGIFDFEQMNMIRDAHRDWCAENSIDAASPVGQDMAAMMFRAYREGRTTPEELLTVCDDYVRQRQEHVRLGAPAIDSHS